jgi:hypothetical protein
MPRAYIDVTRHKNDIARWSLITSSMATFVVCTRCGKTQEIEVADEFPTGWRQLGPELLCPRCTNTLEDAPIDGIFDEEVTQRNDASSLLDEDVCRICRGPCQGH